MTSFSPEQDILLFPARQSERPDPLIPMINIVFLLLTFFMIAGTFQAADILDIDPPDVASEGLDPKQGPLILIDRDGVIALGGEILKREALVKRLKQQAGEAPPEIQLKVDRATRVHHVLPLLKTLSENGIQQVHLIAVSRPHPVSSTVTAFR